MRKIISILMAMVLLAIAIPTAALAAGKIVVPPSGKPDYDIGKAPLDDTVEYSVNFEVGNNLQSEVSGMPENISIKLTFDEAKQIIKSGLVVKVPDQVPTSANSKFLGWTTKKSSSGVVYHPGDEIKLTTRNRNVTLYGVWERVQTPTYYKATVILMPTDKASDKIVKTIKWDPDVSETQTYTLPWLDPEDYGMNSTISHSGWEIVGESLICEGGDMLVLHNGDVFTLKALWMAAPPLPPVYVVATATVCLMPTMSDEDIILEELEWNLAENETMEYVLPELNVEDYFGAGAEAVFLGWRDEITDKFYYAGDKLILHDEDVIMLRAGWVSSWVPVAAEGHATIIFDTTFGAPTGFVINNHDIFTKEYEWLYPSGMDSAYTVQLPVLEKENALMLDPPNFVCWKNSKTGEMYTNNEITLHDGDVLFLKAVYDYEL